jgi:hypothetical protein
MLLEKRRTPEESEANTAPSEKFAEAFAVTLA